MRLQFRNLSYRYPQIEKYVFRNLSFEMTGPGFNALFGPSGVGKTSFARILSGDIGGYSGEVITEGIDRIAYTYNTERLPGWSSVGKHLTRVTPSFRTERKDILIDAFGIGKVMDQRFSQLSLGQKNRVNLLRYLLQGFPLLILDESLANVDELTREDILLKIKEEFPDTLFLYISHNVVEVATYCREILVFRGAHKQPQTVMVKGQDLSAGQEVDQQKLDRTMLEIMNAA